MPGYYVDIGRADGSEGEFEATDQALVAVLDSTRNSVEGLLTVTRIIEAVGRGAPGRAVVEAVRRIVEADREAPERGHVGEADLFEFARGVVVLREGLIGVLARPEGQRRILGPAPGPTAEQLDDAMLAMGPLPGTPTTRRATRRYVCNPNNHRHRLPIGSQDHPCPTPACQGTLEQEI